MLPLYAEDAQEMVLRINEQAKESGQDIDIQDGFDLYRQFTGIRRLFTETLPEYVNPT